MGDQVRDLELKIAEAICELNCWRTPGSIKASVERDLTESEISVVQGALEAFVPFSVWIKVWQDQDMGRNPRGKRARP